MLIGTIQVALQKLYYNWHLMLLRENLRKLFIVVGTQIEQFSSFIRQKVIDQRNVENLIEELKTICYKYN